MLLLSPLTALAHEHRTFAIGNKHYSVVVGAIGEPVHVDDKAGVEVMVSEVGIESHTHHDEEDEHAGTPVTGLEKSLKVEASAGTQRKTFDLEPRWGTPGTYQAVFYPTVQTTYTYRLMGTINNVPFDVTFTCNPAVWEDTLEETTPVSVSDGVTQILKGGAFGCPEGKAEAQFPEQSGSMNDLATRLQHLEGGAKSTATLSMSIVALVLALAAWMRVRKGM